MNNLFADRDIPDIDRLIQQDEYASGVKREEFVFDQAKVESHELVQRGNSVICISCPTQHAQNLNPGEMIAPKEGGGLKIVKMADWGK